MTELPDMAAALDAIDLQLAADSPEVVLPRDAAALVASAPHDLLDGHPITVADLRNTGAWKSHALVKCDQCRSNYTDEELT